jgi:predicted nucleic acid-binding protein
VKRYADEPGSDWIVALLDSSAERATGTVGVIEVLASIARKQRSGRLTESQASAAREAVATDRRSMTLVDFTASVYQRALGIPERYGLRGCDAIHLACAMALRAARGDEVVAFVTADTELARAADGARFPVIDPAAPPTVP